MQSPAEAATGWSRHIFARSQKHWGEEDRHLPGRIPALGKRCLPHAAEAEIAARYRSTGTEESVSNRTQPRAREELRGGNMRSSSSSLRHTFCSRRFGIETFILVIAASLMSWGTAAAEGGAGATSVWDALTGGKAHLDVRGRIEIADTATTTQSEAYTIRTRLGYGTKPYYGVSVYADFENIAAIKKEQYWDGVRNNPDNKTLIPDPPATELNQAYLKVAPDGFFGTAAIGGRQRLILDDSRFVGNVGWRQNEQTFDAAVAKTSFGVDELQLLYGYLWDINRIFGNKGDTPATRNWKSSSHLINLSYSGLPFVKMAAFAYILSFDSSPSNSCNTVGTRLNGDIELVDKLSLGYQASYAFQWDGGRDGGENPLDYQAHYAMVDAKLAFKPVGALGGGYELLGSDDGTERFLTPLATAHKFNGWADVFVNNGGPNGLQDMYAYVAPKLPWEMQGKLVYHHFKSHKGGDTLGNELDALVSKDINKHLVLLAKVAYFNVHGDDAGHVVRGWLQATLKF